MAILSATPCGDVSFGHCGVGNKNAHIQFLLQTTEHAETKGIVMLDTSLLSVKQAIAQFKGRGLEGYVVSNAADAKQF